MGFNDFVFEHFNKQGLYESLKSENTSGLEIEPPWQTIIRNAVETDEEAFALFFQLFDEYERN